MLADRPSLKNVIGHVFKPYENGDHGAVYCVCCHRVLTNSSDAPLETHFKVCVRIAYRPSMSTVFKCAPCSVTTNNFNHWKHLHVGVEAHGNRRDDTYSYTCLACETVVCDTSQSIVGHLEDEHKRRGAVMPPMSVFMRFVYQTRTADVAVSLHYCGACNTYAKDGPVHGADDDTCGRSHMETFYCASCRVTFVCHELTYRWHLSLAEHLALLDEPAANWLASGRGRWKVPKVVWRNFDVHGEKVECGACRRSVRPDDRSLLEHFDQCSARESQPPPTYSHFKFSCAVCGTGPLLNAAAWELHVISECHLFVCREKRVYEHYECTDCVQLCFGTYWQIKAEHDDHVLVRFDLNDLMRYVYDRLDDDADESLWFFYVQSTGNFGRCDPSHAPASVPHQCATCKLEFYGDVSEFCLHAVTVEHLLLQRFALISSPPPPPTKQPVESVDIASSTPSPSPALALSPTPASAWHADDTLDDAYGRYVTARLEAISDCKLKIDIKLAIDALLKTYVP